MGTRAEQFVAQFEATNNALIDAVEGCTDADGQKRGASEGWPFGVLAHHVAISYAPIAGVARTVAEGSMLPQMSPQDQAATNARYAEEHAWVTQQETLDALRRTSVDVAAFLRGLDDEQLARTSTAFGGREMSVAQIVEHVVIGHPKQHLGQHPGRPPCPTPWAGRLPHPAGALAMYGHEGAVPPCTDERPRFSPHRVLDFARRLRIPRSIWRLRAT